MLRYVTKIFRMKLAFGSVNVKHASLFFFFSLSIYSILSEHLLPFSILDSMECWRPLATVIIILTLYMKNEQRAYCVICKPFVHLFRVTNFEEEDGEKDGKWCVNHSQSLLKLNWNTFQAQRFPCSSSVATVMAHCIQHLQPCWRLHWLNNKHDAMQVRTQTSAVTFFKLFKTNNKIRFYIKIWNGKYYTSLMDL